jgi:hypothetical protein
LGAKSHVKHLLVVSDELRLCSKRGDVPDGAGSVYTRSDDETWRYDVPVEGGDRGGVFGRFRIGEQRERG